MTRTWADDERPVNPTAGPTFQSVLAARLSRRDVLRGAVSLAAAGGASLRAGAPAARGRGFAAVSGTSDDRFLLPPGYAHTVLIRWGDPILPGAAEFDPRAQAAESQARQFGYDCDFVGYLPWPPGSGSSTRGLLGVNHESAGSPLMWPGWDGRRASKTREMVEVEVAAHGFTVVEVARGPDGSWSYVRDAALNRRITGATPMALRGPAAGHPLVRTAADPEGFTVLGTLNNCAGGVTPWGTLLSGEENIQHYFTGRGAEAPDPALRRLHARYGIGTGRYGWGRHLDRFDLRREPHEANRFGWVVEIDPYDPRSTPVKHTALGRMAHEGATIALARDGRPVVYMGDDARYEYLYKFVAAGRYDPASRPANLRLLERGTLYVARFAADGTGQWLPLLQGQEPLTAAAGFPSQAEVVVNCRGAADLLGGTRMDRPEDVEPNPRTGKVYAVLTGNARRTAAEVDAANPRSGNRFGHILELAEEGGDHTGTAFRWEVLILGGDPGDPAHGAAYQGKTDVSPLAGPDNLAFDDVGRMWVATDGIAGTLGPNDGVFMVELDGPGRGSCRRFLSAPTGCEVCGPAFTPDGRTLFVAIQHPGLTGTATYEAPGSRWPEYRPDRPPRPSVVAIHRPDGGRIGD